MQVKVCFGVDVRDLPVIEIHRRAQTDLVHFCVVQIRLLLLLCNLRTPYDHVGAGAGSPVSGCVQ
jgi:hypothetical protein